MKKIIIVVIIVLIFAGLSIGVTAYLIQSKNNTNTSQKPVNEINSNNTLQNQTNETNNDSNENNSTNKINEKTIDLSGTYSQNDLTIEEITYDGTNEELKIPQINGLKDKKVQEKVNTHIKNSIYGVIESVLENSKESEISSSYSIKANFSNVLSVYFHIYSVYNSSVEVSDTARLNYKLTDGENLKFEDLFKQDEDLNGILRLAIYRGLAEKQRNEQNLSSYDVDERFWYHYLW